VHLLITDSWTADRCLYAFKIPGTLTIFDPAHPHRAGAAPSRSARADCAENSDTSAAPPSSQSPPRPSIRILTSTFNTYHDRMHHQTKRRRQCHQLRTRVPAGRSSAHFHVGLSSSASHITCNASTSGDSGHRKLQRLLRCRFHCHRNKSQSRPSSFRALRTVALVSATCFPNPS